MEINSEELMSSNENRVSIGGGTGGSLRNRLRIREDHIKVVCRVRPTNKRETGMMLVQRKCITVQESSESLVLNTKPDPKTFSFDYVADENVSQDEMFQLVGLPITQSCLEGFNGTIICYGQTGSGKSYTTFGPTDDRENRGLVPRVLEYLWRHIESADSRSAAARYSCKCSFYEIYQERVFDLLDVSSSGSLQVREDAKMGVHVEGITEERVTSASDVNAVLERGYRNRHIGETAMNRESSRSHAVFTLIVDVYEDKEDDIRTHRQSRFSMVDLAGSERQRDTSATGERLKEAGVINKSLSALGNVIKSLAERSKVVDPSKVQHIHYRDSKLTFLLRDSIGGNSKTVLVATVSPSETSMAETLSTLQFAQRAKRIRNAAVVNEDVSGNVQALQREVVALRNKLAALAQGSGAGTGQGGPLRDAEEGGSAGNLTAAGEGSSGLKSAGGFFDLSVQALLRCRTMEEERNHAEEQCRALQERLAQFEKVPLSLKMQLKMRDAEISRLKKGTEPAPVEEQVRTELDALREQLHLEILTHKAKAEESERRLAVYLSLAEEAGGGGGLWTQSREEVFTREVLERLETAEERYGEMQDRLELAGSQRFEEAFGFTLSEARTLRTAVEQASTRAQEADVMLGVVREESACLTARVADLQREAAEMSGSLSSALVEEQHRVAHLEQVVANMERELRDRDETVAALMSASKASEDTERQSFHAKEFEYKKQVNKAMKDNAILISITQKLEREAAARTEQLASTQAAADEFRVVAVADYEAKLCVLTARVAELGSALDSSLSAREELARQAEELSALNGALETESSDLEERLSASEEALRKALRDADKLTFELENANETNDNLYQQTEQLLEERQSFVDAVARAEERGALLAGELAALRGVNEELQLALQEQSAEVNSAMLADLIRQKDEGAALLSESRAAKAQLESAYLETAAEGERLHAELASLTQSCVELKRCLDATKQQEQDAHELLEGAALERDDAKAEVSRLRGEVVEAHGKLAALQQQAAGLTEELAVAQGEVQRVVSFAEQRAEQESAQLGDLLAEREAAARAMAVLQVEVDALLLQSGALERERDEAVAARVKAVEARDLKIFDFHRAQQADSERLTAELEGLRAERDQLEERVRAEAGRNERLLRDTALLRACLDKLSREPLAHVPVSEPVLADRGVSEEANARLAEEHRDAEARAAALSEELARAQRSRAQALSELADAQAAGDVRAAESSRLRAATDEEKVKLREELEAAQQEIARLCGQHNNKQRIQQHMKLKRELEEQAQLLRHQQGVIGDLTLERDGAREEARRHRQLYKDASAILGTVSETVDNSKRRLSDTLENVRKSPVKGSLEI